MPTSEQTKQESLTEVMQDVIGERTQRAIAQEAGVNQTTIHNMLLGRKVSYGLAVRIADNLQLEPGLRARFFAALGYADPKGDLGYEPVLEETTVEALRGARDLPAEDLQELNRLLRQAIDERRRARGLG